MSINYERTDGQTLNVEKPNFKLQFGLTFLKVKNR